MIKNCIHNICLITFALIGPISLPAGGIQRNFDYQSIFENPQEITLNTDSFMYVAPQVNSKKLRSLKAGISFSVLRSWDVSDRERWIRVQLSQNPFFDDSSRAKRGWLRI